jgi:hypothetical protein
MLFNKPLAEIDESDLQMLVDNNVREGREVEYKEALTITTPAQQQEFLNDVSSFANTSGGTLIYGIKENNQDAGTPVEVCGLKGENPGGKIVHMVNIINTGLDPQLQGVSIFPVALPSHEGRVAIALSIPKSYASPHMVKSSGRFYSRNSAGKFPLDVTQLRTAFELAGTTAERIRSFRVERLSRISSGEETPAPLNEQEPKLVLHLVPLNAFSTSVSLDLKPLYDSLKGKLLEPLSFWDVEPTVSMRFNLDGIARSTRAEFNSTSTIGYTQVFRNGIIESVDTSLIGINAQSVARFGSNIEPMSFSGEKYERKLLEATKRYTELQKLLAIEPPFFIMVSFLGVKGYRIFIQKSEYDAEFTDKIDRMNLIIPEVMVENFDVNLSEVMKPIFDTVWNAAGYIASPNYDASGKFKFGY